MSDRPLSDEVRAFQIIWGAIVAGALLGVGVLWWLRSQSEAVPIEGGADTLFLVNASVSVAAIVGAFALQRMLPGRVVAAESDGAALNRMRALGIASIAVMEASALVAGVIAFLTGNALNLAFVVPFLAFAALFAPTRERVEGLVGLRR